MANVDKELGSWFAKNSEPEDRRSFVAEEIRRFLIENPGVKELFIDPPQDLSLFISQFSNGIINRLNEIGIEDYDQEITDAVEFIFNNYQEFIDILSEIIGFWKENSITQDRPPEIVFDVTLNQFAGRYEFTAEQVGLAIRVAYHQMIKNGSSWDKYFYMFAALILVLSLIAAASNSSESQKSNNLPQTVIPQVILPTVEP